MTSWMRDDAVEVMVQSLTEMLPTGALPEAQVREMLRKMVLVLTTASCGCSFDSHPANVHVEWEMDYCAKHAGNV
jgi:hypothetical protein